MRISLPWRTDKKMRALFSNVGSSSPDELHLLLVYHSSRKSGLDRIISVEECKEIIEKYNRKNNTTFKYVDG